MAMQPINTEDFYKYLQTVRNQLVRILVDLDGKGNVSLQSVDEKIHKIQWDYMHYAQTLHQELRHYTPLIVCYAHLKKIGWAYSFRRDGWVSYNEFYDMLKMNQDDALSLPVSNLVYHIWRGTIKNAIYILDKNIAQKGNKRVPFDKKI